MKIQLKRSLATQVETPTQFQVNNLTLDGKELEEKLNDYLSRFTEGILDSSIAGKSPQKFISNLQNGLLGDFSKRYIITAHNKNEVIGILIALPEENQLLHIFALHVAPEYRNKGVGSTLLSKCINDMAVSEVKEIILDVHINNKPAYNLYKKFNFEEV